MDLLARDDAPLSADDWAALDKVVYETARRYLVGRRFVPLFGPLGDGMPAVPTAGLVGCGEGETLASGEMSLLPLKTISRDFMIKAWDIETASRLGVPLDWSPAAAAAFMVAKAEDELVFGGCDCCGAKGLQNTEGAQKLGAGDWTAAPGLLQDVVKAVGMLVAANCPGPYAVVLPPAVYAAAHRPLGQGPQIEIEVIGRLAQAGVFASNALCDGAALVLEPGPWNVDLAVGADIKTAYLAYDNMTHLFRVFETVALRVKRPESIVVVGGG